MDDAGRRVSRYLRMQLVVNVTYGIAVAIGLSFIGLPNAILWVRSRLCFASFPTLARGLGQFPIMLSLAFRQAG
jgi:predicted PurR-regulated permease PerM